jgi:hypothetical protein
MDTLRAFRLRLWAARTVLIAGALFAVGLAPAARADTTVYTYTGNAYKTCGGTYCAGGPFALSVMFDTILTGNALDNLPFTDITATITSFNFTDGSGLTLDNSNDASGQHIIQISTNASGGISAWFVGAYTSPANTQMQTNWHSPTGFIPGADFSETTPSFAGDFGFISNDPGTWSSRVLSTPEPSLVTPLLTGLLAVAFMARKRNFPKRPEHSRQ